MKGFKFLLAAAAVAACFAKPAHAFFPFGNTSDPVYVTQQSSFTTIDLSTTAPSSASTVVAATTTALGLYNNLFVVVKATSNVGGTMDLYLQTSPDQGTTWVDYVHLPQLAANAAAATYSFTVSRFGASRTAPVVVGTGTSVALSSNTVVGGDFGDRMRVVIVSGASTTSGKAQTIKIFASY